MIDLNQNKNVKKIKTFANMLRATEAIEEELNRFEIRLAILDIMRVVIPDISKHAPNITSDQIDDMVMAVDEWIMDLKEEREELVADCCNRARAMEDDSELTQEDIDLVMEGMARFSEVMTSNSPDAPNPFKKNKDNNDGNNNNGNNYNNFIN